MKKSISYFIIIFMLFSCKNNLESGEVKPLNIIKSSTITTDTYIPNSYVFSSTPIFANKFWYYVDITKNSLILLTEDFKFHKSIQIIGESPNMIRRFSDITLTNNYLFIKGLGDLIILNTINNSYNYYKHELDSIDSPIFFNGNYIVGHTDIKEQKYILSSFKFDNEKLFDIKTKLSIPFEKGTDLSEYSGYLATLDNYLFFIKDWQGEVYKIDKDYNIINNRLLEFSGLENINKEIDTQGFLSIYFNAFDVIEFNNDYLAILREIDYEEKLDHDFYNIDPKYVKRKIHLMNKDLKIEKSIHLESIATSINKKGDSLITSKYGEEIIYIYEFDF
ncbi:hypothetical protein H7F37_13605 [Winogradskyella sp. PAMC22761]|nr:hypothetical protein H7F37_13605 [Winogradskyella sp. PAMC22761]